jgi:hypothetical protein
VEVVINQTDDEVCSDSEVADPPILDSSISEIQKKHTNLFCLASLNEHLGNSNDRAFCSSWYAKFPWLHYQEGEDAVYCFHCLVSSRRHYPVSLN